MNLIESIIDKAKLIAKIAALREEQAKAEKETLFFTHDSGRENEPTRYTVNARNGGLICYASSLHNADELAAMLHHANVNRYRYPADALEAKLRAAITTAMIGEPPL